jgi:hypothetical protein
MKHAYRHRQQGAVILTVCLLMLFLFGFMGIALDFGRLFVTKTELQTAMDSCALAAAQELDKSKLSLDRARSAGQTASNVNHVNFQSSNPQLTFAGIDFLNENYVVTEQPRQAVYARCQHTLTGIQMWLLHAMGAFSGNTTDFPSTRNVMASAVATLAPSQSTCPVPLLLVAKDISATNYGYAVGEWVELLTQPGSGQSGFIGWANLDGSMSASETIKEMNGKCDVAMDQELGTAGVQESVATSWNYRFGIYKNSGDVAANPPDFTGYSYSRANWPSGSNAYRGSPRWDAHPTAENYETKSGAYASCADTTTDIGSCRSIINRTLNNFNTLAAPGILPDGHRTYGVSKRVVLVPVSSSYPGYVQGFACMLLLQPLNSPPTDAPDGIQLEFLGTGTPCVSAGMVGGSGGPRVPALVR